MDFDDIATLLVLVVFVLTIGTAVFGEKTSDDTSTDGSYVPYHEPRR